MKARDIRDAAVKAAKQAIVETIKANIEHLDDSRYERGAKNQVALSACHELHFEFERLAHDIKDGKVNFWDLENS